MHNYKGMATSLFYHIRWSRMGMIRNITIYRLLNILHVFFEWKLGISYAKSRPFVVRLEPSAICNLKCPTCVTPKRQFAEGEVKRMDLESFRIIFNSISKHLYRLTFYINGEPMLNTDLFKMIKIASSKNIYTSFSTNFTLMREAYLEPIFDSGLDWISICLDGFSQETYSKYRVNGNVDSVKEGIKMLMEYKIANNYNKPIVNVFTITFNHVKPEIEAIKSFCTEHKVDEHRLRPDNSNMDGSFNYQVIKRKYKKCFWPWLAIKIDADGSVYPCPCATEKGIKYGNLKEQSLDEIWNNEFYIESRKYISGKTAMKEQLNLPCYNCHYFK